MNVLDAQEIEQVSGGFSTAGNFVAGGVALMGAGFAVAFAWPAAPVALVGAMLLGGDAVVQVGVGVWIYDLFH